MRTLDNIDSAYESLSIIRNIEIGRLSDEIDFSFKPLGLYDYHPNIWIWMTFWRMSVIHKISSCGAVLTGSKVLRNTKIDGVRLLDRTTYWSDFDFLVTEPILYDITSKLNFRENDKSGKGKVMSYRITQSDSYGIGGADVDLIVVDKIPNYHKVGSFLYADPMYIMNHKYESYQKNGKRYKDDLKNFFWKFRNHY